MTPLRQKMIDAMQVRGFSARTHHSYLAAVNALALHYHRTPERLSVDELQAYFLYLVKSNSYGSWAGKYYTNTTVCHRPIEN